MNLQSDIFWISPETGFDECIGDDALIEVGCRRNRRIAEAWRYQPGTLAYCPDPTIQQLPPLLRRAKRDKAAANRDQASKIMAQLPSEFPPQELVRVARLSAGLDTLNPRSWIAALRFGFAALRAA